VPKAGTSGGIGFLAPETAAINVLSGSVVLRETGTSQSMVIAPGGQYAIKLKANGPIAESVSVIPPNVPTAAPAPAPQNPAGQTTTSGGWFSKKVAWWIAGAAAATTTIALIATGGGTDCDATCLAQKAQAQQIQALTLRTALQTQAAIATIISSNSVANTQNSVISGLITQLNDLNQQLQNPNLTPAQVSVLVASAQTLQDQMNVVLAALLNANLPGNPQIPGKVPSSDSKPG
jgi:hypothetical protein